MHLSVQSCQLPAKEIQYFVSKTGCFCGKRVDIVLLPAFSKPRDYVSKVLQVFVLLLEKKNMTQKNYRQIKPNTAKAELK